MAETPIERDFEDFGAAQNRLLEIKRLAAGEFDKATQLPDGGDWDAAPPIDTEQALKAGHTYAVACAALAAMGYDFPDPEA